MVRQLALAGDPGVSAETLVQQPALHRIRSLVDEPDRRLDVGHCPRRLVEPGDTGEGGEEIDSVPPGALLGVADLVPELDGALVVGHGLGERVGRLRGGRRPDRPLERARQVVRGVPVEGELGRMGRFRAGARLERPRERGVQAGALPRQQVVVHRLLEQGVAERVALAARRRVGDEHLAADGFAQRLVHGGVVEFHGVGEQGWIHPVGRRRRRSAGTPGSDRPDRRSGQAARPAASRAAPSCRRRRPPRAAPRRRTRCRRIAHGSIRAASGQGRARRSPGAGRPIPARRTARARAAPPAPIVPARRGTAAGDVAGGARRSDT